MNLNKTKNKLEEHPYQDFCEKYSFYIPESHKNLYSAEALQTFLDARYRFFENHDEEIKISAYNPNSDFLWLDNMSIIEILMPDSPFIVDTIVDYCNSSGHNINLIIHPIFNVLRSGDGKLEQLDYPGGEGQAESHVYLEINRLETKELDSLKCNIAANLAELRGVVTDYPEMIARIDKMTFETENAVEEVDWLKENFVLLGLSALENQQLAPAYFGILKKKHIRQIVTTELHAKVQPAIKKGINYRETDLRSNVNKNRQMYCVLLQDEKLSLLLAGHFRHRAEIDLRNNIPPIRKMLEEMAKRLRVATTSYKRKELYKTAQVLPVGLLLTRSQKLLFGWFIKILSNLYATEINFQVSSDRYDIVWAEIIVPLVEAGQLPGRSLKAFVREQEIEMLHEIRYQLNQIEVLFLGFRSDKYPSKKVQDLLQTHAHDLFSTWTSRFRELIISKYSGDHTIKRMQNRFLNGMSPDHQVHLEPDEVLHDLEMLDKMGEGDECLVEYNPRHNNHEDLIKIYSFTPAKLSDLVPILSNFGFVIDREYTFPFTADGKTKYTYVFTVPRENLEQRDRSRIGEAVAAVLNKKTNSRNINELVRVAGLTARELDLAKAFCGYFFKINSAYAFSTLEKVLVKYPTFSKSLIQFFQKKCDFKSKPDEVRKAETAVEACFADLESVIDENICRTFFNIVKAIVRTNYYLAQREIAFKIKSSLIEDMTKPVPYFEIYLHSYDLEGVHLRGGPVARGGIRWSDRQDDFRTEVLGLLKAQMVKNTLIVPVGSKGGFVLKNRSFANKQEMFAAGVEAYKRYISALLDLTDNLSAEGMVIPAPNIKRLDGDDTYLVVAADKGTATFSDIANEISLKRGFWLTDAFASGGSNGYDHKKQGITAKGAWEAVKRHFHEIGINPEKNHITTAGIGDMGGDVFGNGMLLSQSMKLVAAFNHLYIFLDPDPDPEASFMERKRLFEKVANWDEYNKELISKGGGVYDRSSRNIPISSQVREALGSSAKSLSGEELIKAILRAPVDLLWNGGIGTYVKASNETPFQAGDSANDRVRVDATQLRCRIIGEGGNLGLTQAARVEAANLGVRLNTDAVDNSGGVNMSDHEVNLKILLDNLIRKNIIKSVEERNEIIRKYESDEIKLVLKDNYVNNLGLSLDTRRLPSQFIYIRALIKFLNTQGLFERAKDGIPFESDLDRIEQGSRTLARPVLCALTGFAKLYGTQFFLDSDAFNDPWYDRFILRYFPEELSEKYAEQIKAHPLKREIIITMVVNDIVNHAGVTFFQRMVMASGKSLTDIADAYLHLSEFLNLPKLRTYIGLNGEWLNANIHYEFLIFLEEKVYQITKRLLKNPKLIQLIDEEDSKAFNDMLREASKYSTYRLPRKLRIMFRMLEEKESNKILNAFHKVDVIDDTFNIFINNKSGSDTWNISEYFGIFERYRIKELRQITKDLKATSTWEVRFFSKLDTSIERLISELIKLRDSKDEKEVQYQKQKARNMVNEIIDLHTRSELSIAAFYEMLQYINTSIL